ncbi:GNAT family N-acetyltransferase [Cellulomonas taurus]|uniref:GNAT family N-acetyltransferase n=1 Tax=Cellulomonas taurus TaxID=2729175 RepID=UPI00145E3964|nr:N-acetyltransferase [Cellulomonas taurus]
MSDAAQGAGQGDAPAAEWDAARWARDELVLDMDNWWAAVETTVGQNAACLLYAARSASPAPADAPAVAERGSAGEVSTDPAAEPPTRVLLAVGDPVGVTALVDQRLGTLAGQLSAAWIATDALPALRDRLTALGLRPNRTGWEWMVIRDQPTPVAAESRVRPLTSADRDAAIACLAVANPTTEAAPLAAGERWWGAAAADGGLLGVIGAESRPGDREGAGSWHLHGLGVRPEARRQGLGGALTAGAARALLDDGADWVSLGMWDDNHGARRIYHRLGFRTTHRLITLRADPPR